MLNIRHVAIAVTVAIAAYATVAAAQGVFRDRDFVVGVIQNYETRDLIDNSSSRNDPSPTEDWIRAVNDKVVWIAVGWEGCDLAMVYLPGGSNAGNIVCKPNRSGTASNWKERSVSASFTTSATFQGNVLTLHGEMKGTNRFGMNHCGLRSDHLSQFTISQTLKMRISGNSCQVLALEEVEIDDDTGTLDGRQTHKVTRTTYTSAGSCKMERRSTQPDSDEKLESFDMSCR